MVMVPVSKGSRSASNALRANSGNSSKNKTPWCAKEISPGRGGEPPPTKATALAVWCGDPVGRWPQRESSKRPAKLAMAALSKASSTLSGGNKPAKRCANIDLPEPGGPLSRTECEPAAAMVKARFGPAWPLTSAMSGPALGPLAQACGARKALQPSLGSGGGAPGSAHCATTSSRWCARNTRASGTKAASSALPGGNTKAALGVVWRKAKPMAKAPRTGRSAPLSESSPANSQPAKRAPSICPLAAKMPMAIAKSKRPESLGRSAGARLTVMRWLLGKSSPALTMAERTRSRASLTSVSAKPTKVNEGRPLAKCTSTATACAVNPTKTRL